MSIFLRAALLGFATGGRSTLGLAAIATSAPGSGSWLTSPRVKSAAVLAAVGECTGDKLPQTPSRLQPQGFIPRIALGAGTAAILSHREGNSRSVTIFAAGCGAAGAAGGTWAGAQWRARATAKLGPDWPGAVTEDLVDVAAAYFATRTG